MEKYKKLSDIDKLVPRPLTAVEEQRLLDEIIDQVVSETVTEIEEVHDNSAIGASCCCRDVCNI